MTRFRLLIVALVLVACGGGESTDEPESDVGTQTANTESTAVTTAATTSSPDVQVTGDFCDDADNKGQLVDGIDFLSSDVEQEINQRLAVIARVEAEAPGEIADDVAVIADAARTFADILADADCQILNVDQNDPRLAAFDDGSLDEASENIADFCGWDFDPQNGGSVDVGGPDTSGGFGDDEIPGSIPEAIVPPNIDGVNDNGAAGVNIASSSSFGDLVTFYTDVIGEPDSETGTMPHPVVSSMDLTCS